MVTQKQDVIVIGGGAAGIFAAVSAKRKGFDVTLLERMPRLGKKILATGSGRCNLLNDKVDPTFYNAEARGLVQSVFNRFGRNDILSFFGDLGLSHYSDEGRIFPVTNQASSVLGVLEIEIRNLRIPVECNCEVTEIAPSGSGWALVSKNGKRYQAKRVILTGGGQSYPALGSNGNAYALAEKLGHKLIEPVPSHVPLLAKDPWCHLLQGQKIPAKATAWVSGNAARTVAGELLFTQYGLSGTAILDVSEALSIALHRDKVTDLAVTADVVPFLTHEELRRELAKRLAKKWAPEDLVTGILPSKFVPVLAETLKKQNPDLLVNLLKEKKFKISGTRGWNEAEFTAGGVSTGEIREGTLESKLQTGFYLAGEILNVQGQRGGYNLAWAWSSGYVAGLGL
ncbi:MAG: aminoacetone oxidase family FAD-binding enzyme [Candidatus Omnitrophica bacterium]|nr:aminoacetone oxidase family FAD-binding enzyme [Candidatus Omnitrophota bacterium]MDD5671636.1 aminoacetone oxidase family FAD-binding enzyme [Candidatus Omnitrophota bacterium]